MKKLLSTWLLVGTFTIAGCASGTSGGPGAKDTGSAQPMVGQADETFQLSKSDAVLRQGQTTTVSITIKRALNFSEDVTLKLSALPKGVTVSDPSPVIK